MSNTQHVSNPFARLPGDQLAVIREYFLKSEFAGRMGFERYLAWLHEDGLIPEEALDAIASHNSDPKVVYTYADDLIEDLKKGYEGHFELLRDPARPKGAAGWFVARESAFVRQYKNMDSSRQAGVDLTIRNLAASDDPARMGRCRKPIGAFSSEIGSSDRLFYGVDPYHHRILLARAGGREQARADRATGPGAPAATANE